MRQRNQDGALSVAYPQLAFQTADDVLGLLTLTRGKQLRDDRYLLVLRLWIR